MKGYNVTDLDPEKAFERHVFHRDQFAHYLRWTHVLKVAKIGARVVDFGCGKGNLAEVLYRNKFKPKVYFGMDIRKETVAKAREKFAAVPWAKFAVADLTHPNPAYKELRGDLVCSFEVAEHVGKQRIQAFLANFKACGGPKALYLLSTPNYDPGVGAAGNHTYDSGDGRGAQPQEFGHEELAGELSKAGFMVKYKFGTFASQRDYEPLMSAWQRKMYEQLKAYYDSNLVANLMAPFFPAESRNTLWALERRGR